MAPPRDLEAHSVCRLEASETLRPCTEAALQRKSLDMIKIKKWQQDELLHRAPTTESVLQHQASVC